MPDSALSNLLDGLRIVNPRCDLFTAFKKEQTVFSDQEISSDKNVAAFDEVSSCNCTNSASSAASINTGTDICEMDTSYQDSNFFHVGCISPYAVLPPSVDDIKEKAKGIKRKLHFNKNEIEILEKRTRLQSKNCDLFLYRKGRITASKCKRVASLKPTTSPSRTLKELLMVNEVPQTYAMLQGLEDEDAIADPFIDKIEEEGNPSTFIRCFSLVRLMAFWRPVLTVLCMI